MEKTKQLAWSQLGLLTTFFFLTMCFQMRRKGCPLQYPAGVSGGRHISRNMQMDRSM